MTNTEKNVAIALFLGIDVHKFSLQKDPEYIRVILGKEEDFDWDSITDFDPDTDWNWLHKAWEKFRDLEFSDKAVEVEHEKALKEIEFELCNCPIGEVFDTLYTAISWHQKLNN